MIMRFHWYYRVLTYSNNPSMVYGPMGYSIRGSWGLGQWVPLDLLFLLYYQCKNPSIIVRQHDQGASMISIYKTERSVTEFVTHIITGQPSGLET